MSGPFEVGLPWLSFPLRLGHISLSRNLGLYYGYLWMLFVWKFCFLSCSSEEFGFLCSSEPLIGFRLKVQTLCCLSLAPVQILTWFFLVSTTYCLVLPGEYVLQGSAKTGIEIYQSLGLLFSTSLIGILSLLCND